MRAYLLVILLSVLLFSECKNSSNYTEHSNGLKYRFIESNTLGQNPENGDIVVLAIKYYTVDHKLIDASDYYRMQVTNSTYQGDLHSGLQMLQVGDSVCFMMDASNFYEKTRKSDLPKELKQGDELLIYLRLKNIISAESLISERRSLYHTDEQQELSLLKNYLERTNVSSEPTSSGMYIIHQTEGSGDLAVKGNTLLVHYTGKTIDGKVFDTSWDKPAPLQFTIGDGQAIAGWNEGFQFIKKGGKARLIIPSRLAYGKDGFRNIILPYSTLIFDVELIDIQ